MNNIFIPVLNQQDGDIGNVARLDGLVASNAFLDKFAFELDSAGLTQPEYNDRQYTPTPLFLPFLLFLFPSSFSPDL